MSDYTYQPPFPTGPDTTKYRNIGTQGVSVVSLGEHTFVRVEPQALVTLAKEALREASFFLRPAHQQQVAAVLTDPQATPNDRFVARTLLQNSVVASEGVLPVCQDTGTAIVMGKKGQFVLTTGDDAAALSQGIYQAYQDNNLRYSQMAPMTTYQEQNTGNNLPAQIDLYATQGMEYRFTFVAKGGGSANKMYFFQETPALLRPDVLEPWLVDNMRLLGTSACPPYHLVFVIGGTSIERTTKVLKMASVGDLDDLPTRGNAAGQSFRDVELEQRLMVATRELGIGAQFGGVAFAHDVRVIRMSRHGASLPIAMGVSCSADRNIRAKITQEGLFLEQLEHNPGRWLTGESETQQPVPIDLDRPMPEVLAELSKHPVKTRLSLSGTLIVARDLAHARLKVLLDQGEPLPDYIKQHPIYYAGPAKKPEGMPSGSFGPTTASRMDSYIAPFQAAGAALITLAKGNRSRVVTESCQKHGGFYLGSIGGPAAILAKNSIQHVEVVDFPELGMEAVWKIRVTNFPAFILIDDKGNDFFDQDD